jgi:hypothetical protein
MKTAIAAVLASAVGLFAASMLGTAVAEAPTGTPLRTISVQGIANLPVAQNDSAAAATAVYRESMAGAVADGQSKAAFLAGKVGATLASVQSVVEDGGYITCTSDTESSYAEYEGEQPDFGSGPQPGFTAPAAAPAKSPSATQRAKPRRTKSKHPVAKKAASATCTLTAQVSLVYTIS